MQIRNQTSLAGHYNQLSDRPLPEALKTPRGQALRKAVSERDPGA